MQEILDEPIFIEENELPPLIETEEDMPLDEIDKAWITEAVNSSKNNAVPGPNPEPAPMPPTAPQKWWHNPPKFIWIITVLVGLGGWANYGVHHSETTAKAADDHTNSLIDSKLNLAKDAINAHVDAKIDTLGPKIDGLSDRVSRIEGSLANRISTLESRADRQTSLATLMDPNRTLATVRAEIELAQANSKPLSPATLVDYKNAVLELPSSSYQYWTTVAAIINYQSKLNQMAGEGPDPNKISKPCFGLTNEGRYHSSNNKFISMHLRGCYIDLESVSLVDSVIENSVVRYSGGPTSLSNVTFVNCTFVVNLATTAKPSKSSPLLLALLNSPKQSSVTVP